MLICLKSLKLKTCIKNYSVKTEYIFVYVLQTSLVFRNFVTTDNVRTIHEVLLVAFQRGRSKGGNFGIITIRSR